MFARYSGTSLLVQTDSWYGIINNAGVNNNSVMLTLKKTDQTTDIGYTYCEVVVGGVTYALSYDPTRKVSILESTPGRIVVSIKGNFHNQTSYLANSTSVEFLLTIYKNRIISSITWVTSGNVVLSDSVFNVIGGVYASAGSSQGQKCYYESSGSEVATTGVNLARLWSSYKWMATIGAEFSALVSILGTPSFSSIATYYAYNSDSAAFSGWNNGTITAGTAKMSVCALIETGEQKTPKYISSIGDSANRLAVGAQIRDTTFSTPTYGSKITDIVTPSQVGTDCLYTDGAYHLQPASQYTPSSGPQLEFYWPNAKTYNQPVVIEDFPILKGASGSAVVSAKYLMDTASGTSIPSAVGAGTLTYKVISGGATRDLSLDTITAGVYRNRGVDTQGLYFFDASVADLGSFVQKGGIDIIMFPQFVFDTPAYPTVFSARIDANNNITLYYEQSTDTFNLNVVWAGQYIQVVSPVMNAGILGSRLHIRACWSGDQDQVALFINGVSGTPTSTGGNVSPVTPTPSSATLARLVIGASWDGTTIANGCDAFFDTITMYNDGLLPMGAMPTGLDQVGSYDRARRDILMYWSGRTSIVRNPAANADLDIGSANISTNASTSNFYQTGGPIAGYFNTGGSRTVRLNSTSGDVSMVSLEEGTALLWASFSSFTVNSGIIKMASQLQTTFYLEAYISASAASGTGFTVTFTLSNGTVTGTTQMTLFANVWYPIRISWKNGVYASFQLLNGAPAVIKPAKNLSSPYVSPITLMGRGTDSNVVNGKLGAFYFTSKENSGEIQSVLGYPCWYPIVSTM